MTKFPWKLKYMAKYILKAFFLTPFPSTQKKCPKIYAVTLVLPLKDALRIHSLPLLSIRLISYCQYLENQKSEKINHIKEVIQYILHYINAERLLYQMAKKMIVS